MSVAEHCAVHFLRIHNCMYTVPTLCTRIYAFIRCIKFSVCFAWFTLRSMQLPMTVIALYSHKYSFIKNLSEGSLVQYNTAIRSIVTLTVIKVFKRIALIAIFEYCLTIELELIRWLVICVRTLSWRRARTLSAALNRLKLFACWCRYLLWLFCSFRITGTPSAAAPHPQ